MLVVCLIYIMVISGINAGPNLGDDVLYSGTVAAAMEGRFLGFPALAVSSGSFTPQHLDVAAGLVNRLIDELLADPLPGNIILSLNVPDLELEGLLKRHFTQVEFFQGTVMDAIDLERCKVSIRGDQKLYG